jgi:dihydroneopterin aldolase
MERDDMSSEIRLAFAHPSERAEATAPRTHLDRISLRDHVVEVEIGAFQAERGTTQRVQFNVVVEVTPITGPIDDDVDRILSYDHVTESIAAALADERLNLLETLADRVAELILTAPQAVRVFVRIEKLDRGPGALGVEIVRGRDQVDTEANVGSDLAPRLAFLSNKSVASGDLTAWIDVLLADGKPLVLCVGAPDFAVAQTGHAMTQRRIDLLAIEQNAWLLAARDHRCKVVATRTELDWAMKNGQICVWAPSKIVLDAVDGPATAARDAVALAAWFAASFDAEELLVIGADVPEQADVPIRVWDGVSAPASGSVTFLAGDADAGAAK